MTMHIPICTSIVSKTKIANNKENNESTKCVKSEWIRLCWYFQWQSTRAHTYQSIWTYWHKFNPFASSHIFSCFFLLVVYSISLYCCRASYKRATNEREREKITATVPFDAGRKHERETSGNARISLQFDATKHIWMFINYSASVVNK